MGPLRSVRARLLLMVTAVLLVAVAAVAWSSRRVTHSEFNQFVQRLETELDESGAVEGHVAFLETLDSLGNELQLAYRGRGGWDGADAVLHRHPGELSGRIVVVIDSGDHVVASSEPELAEAHVEVGADGMVQITEWQRSRQDGTSSEQRISFRGPSRPIRDAEGTQVAALYVLPDPEMEEVRRFVGVNTERDFLGSLDRWMLGVVLVVAGLALGAAVAFSGRIVGPIERLTEASRRMEAGDLGHRVDVRSNDEIGELAAAFNSMAEALSRNERLRRDMVSDVAHELRTPLTNLRGQLEAVQDGLVEPSAALITSLHEETMLLNRLIDDLQELALAEAGQLRLEIEDIDVAAEIERARAAFAARVTEGGVAEEPAAPPTIRTVVPEDTPCARGDLQRFRQILGNLLDNAVAHAGGEIVVAAEMVGGGPSVAREVVLDATGPGASDAPGVGSFVRIRVADDGPGIPAERQADIFERFYRTDPSRQRATGGAGLGLAIVRQLVEAQGGEVSLESVPGKGSTFGFTLPAAS